MGIKKRDWKPVLKDGVYCSPACGGGKGICDKSKYDLAVKKANALAKRMGPGWKPRVWENLGWFYEVEKGKHLRISPPHWKNGVYTAWVETSPISYQFIEHHKDPKKALAQAFEKFDEYISYLQAQRKKIGKL
jgi:hypothetical protein